MHAFGELRLAFVGLREEIVCRWRTMKGRRVLTPATSNL
jgi:hypothetical protein